MRGNGGGGRHRLHVGIVRNTPQSQVIRGNEYSRVITISGFKRTTKNPSLLLRVR